MALSSHTKCFQGLEGVARICEAFAPLVIFVRFALLAECYSEFMLAGNVLLTSQIWELLRTMLKPTTKTTEGETEGDVVEEEEE